MNRELPQLKAQRMFIEAGGEQQPLKRNATIPATKDVTMIVAYGVIGEVLYFNPRRPSLIHLDRKGEIFNGTFWNGSVCEYRATSHVNFIALPTKDIPDTLEWKTLLASQKTDRVNRLERNAALLKAGNTPQRVASMLLDLYASKSSFEELILQQSMGEYIGVARETVSKQMGRFLRQGIISIDNGGIIIKKPEKLQELLKK